MMKYNFIVCCTCFLLITCGVRGDVFVHFDWTRFAYDGVLPETATRFELGGDYDDVSAYKVSLDYPEWVEMTKSERVQLKKLEVQPADTVRMNVYLSVSRKQGLLDVNYLPVIRRDGRYLKLLSAKVTLHKAESAKSKNLVGGARAPLPVKSRYAAHSVLSQGKWVKIRVKDEGVYSLTPAFLKSLGFQDASKVKVYGYGGLPLNEVIAYDGSENAHFDDLEEVPLMKRTDDYIFYANGTMYWSADAKRRVYNPYSQYSYYFLTEGNGPTLMKEDEKIEAPATVQTVKSVPYGGLVETDAFSWLQSSRNLYDSYNFADGNSKNYTLNLPQIDSTQATSVTINFSAGNYTPTSVQLSANGYALGSFTVDKIPDQYTFAQTALRTYTTSRLGERNTFNIKTTSGNAARLDYILVAYQRKLSQPSTFLTFRTNVTDVARYSMSGANSNTQVWRIGSAGHPAGIVPASLSGNTLSFVLEKDHGQRYVAVNTAATFPQPEKVGSIANQDLHADSLYDMVIIIPESGKLLSQAERLANAHREKDSLRVKIVKADLLYNEFSSGTPDATAYRKYMKMLYDKANTEADMPKYLLLLGPSLWDNRMITSHTHYLKPQDYLLCYESDDPGVSEVDSYVSDDYFGFLDDGEGASITRDKLDLGIGRLPLVESGEAQIVVDKILDYMNNRHVGNWKNNVYIMADDGDNNSHMIDADTVRNSIVRYNPNLQVKRIYWDAYERVSTTTGNTYPAVVKAVKEAMNRGALIMDYSGHGSPYQISHERVLNLADFKEFSSAKIPLWVVASCELTPFDMLEENIGETSLLNKKGAAIAFFSSSRAAYATQNRYVNNYFTHYALGADNEGRRCTLGDAARLAKVSLVSDYDASFSKARDYSSNKLKYALMGDPALTLASPTHRVVLDKINDVAVSTTNPPTLKAGSTVKISGHIEKESKELLSGFNGVVSLILMDTKDTIICKNNTNASKGNHKFTEYTKTLYEGSDSVKNGRFELSLIVPLDIKYSNEAGRMSLYAVNNAHTIEANGACEAFLLGGTADVKKDTVGPAMYVYLNDPDFQDGGTVNPSPYFYAVLSDSSGINRTGNGVGHDIQLVIDSKEEYSFVLNDYFSYDFGSHTRGSLAYKIPNLPEGEHRLFFRAWDTRNNSSATILNFVVKGGLAPSLSDVKLTHNPARSNTTFIISYDRPETDTKFTIEVYDCFGRLWWSHDEVGQSSDGYYTINWNLVSNGGVPMPNGLYLFKVGIACEGSKEITKTNKLVIRKQ